MPCEDLQKVNPLRPILIIFMHTLFTKSQCNGFCTHMYLMPLISYTKYPMQKLLKLLLPFCPAEKVLSFAINFFSLRLFFAIDSPVCYGRV